MGPSLQQRQHELQQSHSRMEEETLIPLLASRSYHLPGNSWLADWMQWYANNHILFGICLHHKLHPLEWWERLMALVGSIAFGLSAVNVAYLIDHYDYDLTGTVFTIPWNGTEYVVTKANAVLWTLGGACHSIFDFLVWNIMACSCCHPGGRWAKNSQANRLKDCGSFLLIPVVIGLVVLAVFETSLRKNSDEDLETGGTGGIYGGDDQISAVLENGLGEFSFLSEYIIEIVLAWLVYFPVFGTLLFSGVLGCGKLPLLGGRPRDKRLVEEGKFDPDYEKYNRFM